MTDYIIIILLFILVLENSRYFFEWLGRKSKELKHAVKRQFKK